MSPLTKKMMNKTTIAGLATMLLIAVPAPSTAQEVPLGGFGGNGEAGERVIYEREMFRYERAGRRDPFRSLLGSADLAVRWQDLTVGGIVHNPDPRQSIAVLRERGGDRRFRVRVGDRIGGIQVRAIEPRRVDLSVTEFGVTTSESLELRRATPRTGNES